MDTGGHTCALTRTNTGGVGGSGSVLDQRIGFAARTLNWQFTRTGEQSSVKLGTYLTLETFSYFFPLYRICCSSSFSWVAFLSYPVLLLFFDQEFEFDFQIVSWPQNSEMSVLGVLSVSSEQRNSLFRYEFLVNSFCFYYNDCHNSRKPSPISLSFSTTKFVKL